MGASGKTVLFLHGFASSAQGTKALFFRDSFEQIAAVDYYAIDFSPTPADFRHMTTTGLIERLRQFVLDRGLERLYLIGSSYGGLVALHFAQRYGGVERMLLLAPALRWLSGGLSANQIEAWEAAGEAPVFHPAFGREVAAGYELQADGLRYIVPVPPAVETCIIHGWADATVPVADSRAYAAEYGDKVHLVEVDADHDLNGHLALAWSYVQSFLLAADTGAGEPQVP